jgi:Phage integrase family
MNKLLRDMVSHAGIKNVHVSGHSLRISGATQMAMAGVPFDVIKVIGRWKSDAVLRYIRSLCAIAQNVTSRIAL